MQQIGYGQKSVYRLDHIYRIYPFYKVNPFRVPFFYVPMYSFLLFCTTLNSYPVLLFLQSVAPFFLLCCTLLYFFLLSCTHLNSLSYTLSFSSLSPDLVFLFTPKPIFSKFSSPSRTSNIFLVPSPCYEHSTAKNRKIRISIPLHPILFL